MDKENIEMKMETSKNDGLMILMGLWCDFNETWSGFGNLQETTGVPTKCSH